MTAFEVLGHWLLHAALLCSPLLLIGTLAVRHLRQPADQLRLIQWVLLACLLAPFLPGLPTRKVVSLNLLDLCERMVVGEKPNTGIPLIDRNQFNVPEPILPNGSVLTSVFEEAKTMLIETAVGPRIVDHKSLPAHKFDNSANKQVNSKEEWTVSVSALLGWSAFAYLAALAVMLTWWWAGLWRRHEFERTARPATGELKELFASMLVPNSPSVRLFVSDRITGPMTWGLLRPVIVLPVEIVESANELQLRWCLTHELSHVERRDVATLILASVVQIVCFYQPFYWWLRMRMILCQDFLADFRAARETGAAEDYAEFLVQLARSRIQPSLSGAMGIAGGKSNLFRRIRFLLQSDGQIRSFCSRKAAVGTAVAAILFLGLFSTIRFGSKDAAQSQKNVIPTSGVKNAEPIVPGEVAAPLPNPLDYSMLRAIAKQANAEVEPLDEGPNLSVPGYAQSKGAFTVWTEPQDLKPMEDYQLVIRIRLPDSVKEYRASDLSGHVLGTDGYRQRIPSNSKQVCPIDNGIAVIRINVPGGTEGVRDRFEIASQHLRGEKQTFEINH